MVLAGASGVGKSSVVSALRSRLPEMYFSVSVTTRAPRPGEVDGVHYHFVDPARFDELIARGELLEWAEIHGGLQRSGTPREPVERALVEGRPVLVEVDLAGARTIKAVLPEAVTVFLAPPSLAELERLFRLNGLYFTGSREENMLAVTPEIAREIQEVWRARGFYDGPADGVVDAEFQQILVDFMGWENYDLRIAAVQGVDLSADETLRIDREVLDDIRAVFAARRWRPRTR